jgi:hypothetical protein
MFRPVLSLFSLDGSKDTSFAFLSVGGRLDSTTIPLIGYRSINMLGARLIGCSVPVSSASYRRTTVLDFMRSFQLALSPTVWPFASKIPTPGLACHHQILQSCRIDARWSRRMFERSLTES